MTDIFEKLINQNKLVKLIRHLLHPDGIRCPKCKTKQIHLKSKKKVFPRHYQCKKCKECFSENDGTILKHIKLSWTKFIIALLFIYLGHSSNQIAKELQIDFSSASSLMMKVFKNLFDKGKQAPFHGEVESDEVYVNTGRKGECVLDRAPRKRGLKQRGRGTYEKDKPPVFGIVCRTTGLVFLSVMINLKIQTIKQNILDHVSRGTLYYTDEYSIYSQLDSWGYQHRSVCHSSGQYAIDLDGDGICETHCNTMEGIWSLLRQYLRQFRGIAKKNLKYYVRFFEWRYNSKKLKMSAEKVLLDMIKL